MYKLSLCMLLCIVASVSAELGCSCTSDRDCDYWECCEIPNLDMIASKRQVTYREGTCQQMKYQGDYCDVFSEQNGYCGCGPGLGCYSQEVPDCEANKGKRAMAANRPGYSWVSTCEWYNY